MTSHQCYMLTSVKVFLEQFAIAMAKSPVQFRFRNCKGFDGFYNQVTKVSVKLRFDLSEPLRREFRKRVAQVGTYDFFSIPYQTVEDQIQEIGDPIEDATRQ